MLQLPQKAGVAAVCPSPLTRLAGPICLCRLTAGGREFVLRCGVRGLLVELNPRLRDLHGAALLRCAEQQLCVCVYRGEQPGAGTAVLARRRGDRVCEHCALFK